MNNLLSNNNVMNNHDRKLYTQIGPEKGNISLFNAICFGVFLPQSLDQNKHKSFSKASRYEERQMSVIYVTLIYHADENTVQYSCSIVILLFTKPL